MRIVNEHKKPLAINCIRSETGAVLVDDKFALDKYIKERERTMKIVRLEEEIEEIKRKLVFLENKLNHVSS